MRGADLRSADMRGACLRGVDFDSSGETKRSADLRGANLKDADLSFSEKTNKAADLRGADLTRANLTGAHLRDARYDSETSWPKNFDPSASGAVLVPNEANTELLGNSHGHERDAAADPRPV
jgi:uncharacterized protein YjbI with pentapeptide repeats